MPKVQLELITLPLPLSRLPLPREPARCPIQKQNKTKQKYFGCSRRTHQVARVIISEEGLGWGKVRQNRILSPYPHYYFMREPYIWVRHIWFDFSMFPWSTLTSQYYTRDSKGYSFHLIKREEERVWFYLQFKHLGHEPQDDLILTYIGSLANPDHLILNH